MGKIRFSLDEISKYVFKVTTLIMILAHGFCFVNLMYSHDSLGFYDMGGFGKVRLGRWFYPFLVHMRLIASPWLLGIFGIFYVSLAVVFVTRLFGFNKVQGFCVGIIFGTNVTLTTLFCTYIFNADADCLSLLLACLAVYSFKKFPSILNIITPVIALVLCLALYQAYICVAIGLFILLLITESSKCASWKAVMKVFLVGIKELMILAIASAVYVLLMHLASQYCGMELSTDYNGAGKLSTLSIREIINSIPKSYGYFRNTFLYVTEYNTIMIVVINWMVIVLLLISIMIYIIEHRKFLGSLVVILPCFIIMPLGLNAIYIVSFGMMHQLMIFAFYIAYLLPIVFISELDTIDIDNKCIKSSICFIKKAASTVLVLAIAIIGFHNIVYSNGAYVYKKLVYDNTALHAQTIWKDINNVIGYNDGETQVVFMGDFTASKAVYNSPVVYRYYTVLSGADNSAITYEGTETAFYEGIMGRELDIVYNCEDIKENIEFKDMPTYPTIGYCRMIGDKVVVKLSD